jgi:ubiquitin-conjugating enzyme E2 J2
MLLNRIKGELKILAKNKSTLFQVIVDESDIKIFYFLLRPLDEPYKGGLYIGKIELPENYPHKAPDYYMLTPSGRFDINKKICLSISGFHNDTWSPTWNILKIVEAFLSILYSDKKDEQGLNHLQESDENRKKYASESIKYNIKNHPSIFKKFNYFVNENFSIKSNDEINKIINP